MIQKKICMVGVYGTGKTSLVRRYVHQKFSDRYLSTVGVKISKKQVNVGDVAVNLLLWDLAGRDEVEDVPTSYLRGAAGILFVVDGTRRDTFEQTFELRDRAREAIGAFAGLVALNKVDLTDQWKLDETDYARLKQQGWYTLRTSAKTGEGVEDAFHWLASAVLER